MSVTPKAEALGIKLYFINTNPELRIKAQSPRYTYIILYITQHFSRNNFFSTANLVHGPLPEVCEDLLRISPDDGALLHGGHGRAMRGGCRPSLSPYSC